MPISLSLGVFSATIVFVSVLLPGARITSGPAEVPKISSITGFTDSIGGVQNGRWSGQAAHAPSGAKNTYRGWLAVEGFDYGQPKNNPYYWEINGTGFGMSTGKVEVGPGANPFRSFTVLDWKPNRIRCVATVPHSFSAAPFTLTVRTAATPQMPQGATASIADKAVGIIRSRGWGQCTWYVAKVRLDKGLPVPKSAFETNFAISAVGSPASNYRPKQWDCLNYGGRHVAIITSKPAEKSNADGSITWKFEVSECNYDWQEKPGSSSREFTLSKPDAKGKQTVVAGIGTLCNRTWFATGCYR